MSLRTRLFLFFAGLIGLLVGAEWALVTALTDELEEEVGEVAFEVGSGVLGKFFPRIVAKDGLDSEEIEEVEVLEDVNAFRVRRDASEPPHHMFALQYGDEGLARSIEERFEVRGNVIVEEIAEIREQISDSKRQLRNRWRNEERSDVLRIVVASKRKVHQIVGHGAHSDVPHSELELQAGVVFVDLEKQGLVLPSNRLQGLSVSDGDFEGIVHIELGNTRSEFTFAPDVEQDQWFGASDDGRSPAALAVAPASGGAVPRSSFFGSAAPAAEDGETFAHEIPIPRDGFDASIDTFLRRLWLGTFVIFGLGLIVAGWFAHRVSVPLRDLSRAAREVGDGALGTQVVPEGDPEVAETITAFNQMSQRLAALDAEASTLRDREHLTEIGEVARGLAHAMRNPLHLLGLSVEQLAACDPREERGAGLVDAARSQIHRIDRSLRSFLSLSSGGGEATAVDVDDLARDVALELLQDQSSQVNVKVEAAGPCSVRAVAPELRAVLHVLVVNAVEASPTGAEVLVRVTCDGNRVRMEVEDEGPGLAAEVRDQLFTPHLTTKEQGAGMGLFLAHRIATSRYAGSLALVPREPCGTRAILEVGDRGGELGG